MTSHHSNSPCQRQPRHLPRLLAGGVGTLLLAACTNMPPRSVQDLPPVEHKAMERTSTALAEESAKFLEAQDKRLAAIEKKGTTVPTTKPLAPAYDPLEHSVVSISMFDADVGQLLWALAGELKMNLIVDPKVLEQKQRSSLQLSNVSAREVFNQSLSKHGGGAIVNMAADMWNGMAGMAHSGAARAGMVNLTKTAACEWARAHVRVNAVAPGWVASSGMDSYGPAMAPMILSLKDNLPMRRLGLEAEISSVICFLLSPGAAFVTGVTVAIDGGAGVNNPVWPKAPHEPAPSFNGFHRATTPKVLQGL